MDGFPDYASGIIQLMTMLQGFQDFVLKDQCIISVKGKCNIDNTLLFHLVR